MFKFICPQSINYIIHIGQDFPIIIRFIVYILVGPNLKKSIFGTCISGHSNTQSH